MIYVNVLLKKRIDKMMILLNIKFGSSICSKGRRQPQNEK